MKAIHLALGLTLANAAAATGAQRNAVDLADRLGFEVPLEHSWSASPSKTVSLDTTTVHSGKQSARIRRQADSPANISTLASVIPVDFTGKKIELRGFLRSEEISGYANLLLREDGIDGMITISNVGQSALSGTQDWTEFRVGLPLHPRARKLIFGPLLSGRGTLWVDDLQLLVDGRPLAQVPRAAAETTVLDSDQEFSDSSGIASLELTHQQIDNLALLGRIWGFLKYHHPGVTHGEFHWDFELFRAMPALLKARNKTERNAALLQWVSRIGEPQACGPCAAEPHNVYIEADIGWIRDTGLLGEKLSTYLQSVYRNRDSRDNQFYIKTAAQAGNPVFLNEPKYTRQELPDSGYRLLALFRFWNMVEYWFPYRDSIGRDWPAILRQYLPLFAQADSRDAYAQVLMRLTAEIGDTHSSLLGANLPEPLSGNCQLPVPIRFIGDRAVVADTNPQYTLNPGINTGDIILAIDGEAVDKLVKRWTPFLSASNRAAQLNRIARNLTRGPCNEVALTLQRGNKTLHTSFRRLPRTETDTQARERHDRAGDTFQWLTDQVAYLKLSSIQEADVSDYIERARKARGLIVDIRNYPGTFVPFVLGSHLVQKPTAFATFAHSDPANPGAFVWSGQPTIVPAGPYFPGKVTILVDETSISQAEYTAMALRAAPNAVVIGSTTAGADGNISPIPMPGGFGTLFSGLGVFYPDHHPTQQIGIVPDIFVTPTITGIRAGRDEVLERALQEILDEGFDRDRLIEAARRPQAAPLTIETADQ